VKTWLPTVGFDFQISGTVVRHTATRQALEHYLFCVAARRNAAERRQTWGRDTWLYSLGCWGKSSTVSFLFCHYFSSKLYIAHIPLPHIFTDCVSGVDTAVSGIHLFIYLHSFLNRPLTLMFCMFVGHDHRSPGIESQCCRSRTRLVKVQQSVAFIVGTQHCSDRHCSDRHCSDRHCSDKRYPWALYTVSQKKTPISCP